MDDKQITISVHYTDGKFYTNASCPDGSFICTTGQDTLDMSLASAMPLIRDKMTVGNDSGPAVLIQPDSDVSESELGWVFEAGENFASMHLEQDPMDALYGGNIDGGDRNRALRQREDYYEPADDEPLVLSNRFHPGHYDADGNEIEIEEDGD